MNLGRSPTPEADFVRELSYGRETPPQLDCKAVQNDSNEDANLINSSAVEVNHLPSLHDATERKSKEWNGPECELYYESRTLSCDYIQRTELSESDDKPQNNHSGYEETNFSRNGFARERTEAFTGNDGHNNGLQDALEQNTDKNEVNNDGVTQVQYEDNGDDFDEDYLEKEGEKGDEDDDDLTKKLLSIQVLPRIPKIKRTQSTGDSTSSESSVPQRSVLERAEVTTKSSSYPKWPKSSGSQADEKPRWHPDKAKEPSRTPRIQRPVESSGSSDRFNGHIFSKSSGSNFKQTVDFEKPRTVFKKRVPCEMLFDAVMAKENSQTVSYADNKTNEAEQLVTDLVSCSGSPALQSVDALPAGVDLKGAERKRHSDETTRSCGEKLAWKLTEGNFTEISKGTSALQNMVSRSQSGRQREAYRQKEGNDQKPEAASSRGQCKLSDFQLPEKTFSSSAKSSYHPDKRASLGGISTVPLNEKSGEILTSNDKLGAAVQSGSQVSDGLLVPSRIAPFLPPSSASSLLSTSEDARFKRPSIQIVPRSRNPRGDPIIDSTSKVLPQSIDHSVIWNQSDEQSGAKSSPAETSKQPAKVEEEVPIPWGPEDGVMVELPKPKKAQKKQSLPPLSLSSSQSTLDSSMEVVDMDVSASPLCEDNLLTSTDPVGAVSSGAQATTRKMVTFDCPEDTGCAHRDSSKKLKAAKHDREAQRTMFEAKCDVQQHVVTEMKEILRPLYSKRKINKEEYKEIMRQAVPKICHNRKSRVGQSRIKKYAERYTSRVLKSRKHPTTDAENGKEVPDLAT